MSNEDILLDMSFPKPPNYTKGEINRAGDILVNNETNEAARSKLNEWRACHAYPINTFQATLRDKLKKLGLDDSSIVAQRSKRAPTIIDKLRRYPKMKLTQMQDIGGLRAIVPTVKDVRLLVKEYKKSRFAHKLVREKDYIEFPRKEDGYRSVHLIYEYDNPKALDYKGLMLELQIRTKLQHSWATAVETVGFLLNQALKSRHGDKDWLHFFAMVSAAFAVIEGTNPLPGTEKMSKKEIFKEVADAEKKIGALETMRGIPVAIDHINTLGGTFFYYLIMLDLDKKMISTKGFAKEHLAAANKAYAEQEDKIAKSAAKVELVLVSAGKIKDLKKAYPNFFLDSQEFIRQVENIIKNSK